MYGGGNIGRGFIAQLFYLSGYHTIFIDVNDELIEQINRDGKYPIYITKNGKYEKTFVENVSAVDGKDVELAAEAIAKADIMATAVGVNILKYIAHPIACGVKKRFQNNAVPLNIIVCENRIDANEYLKGLVEEWFVDEDNVKNYFHENFGFVEASIGRMVPAAPEQIKARNKLAVCVEPYCELPVDKDAFVGEIPEIKNMVPFSPFEVYIQRKLFVHNMSHAVCAYLGYITGAEYIWQAANDLRIRYIALGAQMDICRAMSKEHAIDMIPLVEYSYDLLGRYDNKLLGDTVARVGADTQRKLSHNDRIVGALRMCKKHGINSKYIKTALAAGLMFAPGGDKSSEEVSKYTIENGVSAALAKYCDIKDKSFCLEIAGIYRNLRKDRNAVFDKLIYGN